MIFLEMQSILVGLLAPAEITRVSGSNIFVDDASVFREGQKIIFGTGQIVI